MKLVAVYSKKDYENYINRDKIRKKKIRKRIIGISSAVLTVAAIVGLVILFMQDRDNHMKTDNYTDAMNVAIEKYATIVPKSHSDYPRLTYNYNAPRPSTLPDNPVADSNNNNNAEEDKTVSNDAIEDETFTNPYNNEENSSIETPDIENTDKTPDNNISSDNEKEKRYEYDYFIEVAGKGNYPGYNIVGSNFIQDIRKELILAIKAYTSMPLSTGSTADDYRLGYYDDTYDYIYFFLIGEVKKVEKSYLKSLDESALNKDSYNVYNFWISLTEDKSSNLANILLNGENGRNYSVLVSDINNKTLGNVKVSYISGSYIETIITKEDSVIVFKEVPFGDAEIRIERDGYIDFPHEVAYSGYEQIKIGNDVEYKGQYISGPLRVKLLASSVAKCSFSYTTMNYEYGVDGNEITQESIGGNFKVKLTNKKTKKVTEETIGYEGDSFYWFEFFPDVEFGIYDIEITPTNVNYDILKLKDVYINEHGIGDDGYLTENSDYIFAFNTDNTVSVEFNITDDTSYGLNSPKGLLGMYQLIKSNVMREDGWTKVKFVNISNKEEIYIDLFANDNDFYGELNIPQNAKYNIYLSTIFGDILLYKDFNVKTSNYNFTVTVKDTMIPKCIADINISRTSSYKIEIINSIDANIKYRFEIEEETKLYQFKTDTPIASGYYYLNFYDKDNNIIETYLILISNKSNNYTLNFE